MSRTIEQLVRPYLLCHDLDTAYADMARDREREQAAIELAEAVVGDVRDEAWVEFP
jgi:hypothetical protein